MKTQQLRITKLLSKPQPALALYYVLCDEADPSVSGDYNEVYLDNVIGTFISFGFTAHQFAGYLSVLTNNGVYKSYGSDFGGVNLDKSICVKRVQNV